MNTTVTAAELDGAASRAEAAWQLADAAREAANLAEAVAGEADWVVAARAAAGIERSGDQYAVAIPLADSI